jgi:histone H3/H4
MDKSNGSNLSQKVTRKKSKIIEQSQKEANLPVDAIVSLGNDTKTKRHNKKSMPIGISNGSILKIGRTANCPQIQEKTLDAAKKYIEENFLKTLAKSVVLNIDEGKVKIKLEVVKKSLKKLGIDILGINKNTIIGSKKKNKNKHNNKNSIPKLTADDNVLKVIDQSQ